ncbi:hypothetical protein CHS0354_016156 [Potamilus streckersoni]|uniref:Uncharacterized protein n=1 Tax=Potamilus streckersoni TaxID=2493646 RepID=A0AAE0SQJ4_9BIVA|nr:hypothetical protein CHS0354_016156 [Potamilus streckersoni]
MIKEKEARGGNLNDEQKESSEKRTVNLLREEPSPGDTVGLDTIREISQRQFSDTPSSSEIRIHAYKHTDILAKRKRKVG